MGLYTFGCGSLILTPLLSGCLLPWADFQKLPVAEWVSRYKDRQRPSNWGRIHSSCGQKIYCTEQRSWPGLSKCFYILQAMTSYKFLSQQISRFLCSWKRDSWDVPNLTYWVSLQSCWKHIKYQSIHITWGHLQQFPFFFLCSTRSSCVLLGAASSHGIIL